MKEEGQKWKAVSIAFFSLYMLVFKAKQNMKGKTKVKAECSGFLRTNNTTTYQNYYEFTKLKTRIKLYFKFDLDIA